MIPRRSGRLLTFVDASVNVGEQSVAQQNPSKRHVLAPFLPVDDDS
jgi:hypothetical protein